jgi:Tol biopolymer transport system component
VLKPDATDQTNLTHNPTCDGDHSWSPGGSKIAFAPDRDDNLEVYVMRPKAVGG